MHEYSKRCCAPNMLFRNHPYCQNPSSPVAPGWPPNNSRKGRHQRATARELAERFDVSTRTIRRDIESICMAGVPLCTHQGPSGGVEIMDGYAVDRSVFTMDEIETICIALRGTDSALGESYTDRLIDKLSSGHLSPSSHFSMDIDLVDYHAAALSHMIRIIRQGIRESRHIHFSYHNADGDSTRTVEPYRLLFRWGNWYLYAYCLLRDDYRLFKLHRLDELSLLEENFDLRPEAAEPKNWNDCFSGEFQLTAIFDDCVRYRIAEEYHASLLTPTDDGRHLFTFCFSSEPHLVSWLLSFGSHVEIVSPESVRDQLVLEAKRIIERHR